MNAGALPVFELLGPLIFVIGTIYLLSPILPLSRPWARKLVFAIVWLVIARYLDWRLFATVMPVTGEWYQVGWVWTCFVIEALALFDAFILYLAFLRTSDRHAEADSHEARLRALPPAELPWVDVYIPTYDESLEVLEKTITGAISLDYPNFKVWLLDDGRRPWLKEFCNIKGVGYLTRGDNAHAKAGNVNHALTKTNADFVAIFDADFIPQRNFLMRTVGFFADPAIGIVQVPHTFYNYDPAQSSLGLQKALPDDQRFFFEAIMPSRDGWDAAFSCGSNSVTRREALRSIGDALPTDSITEDMLLSISLLRNGYITRYLCERLAFGLAPEGLKAFFVQRQRWARGAMQILFLAAGPQPHPHAAVIVSAYALAYPKSHAAVDYRRAFGVPVDRRAAARQCDARSSVLLPSADDAGRGGRHLGLCAAPVFSIRRSGARNFPKLQDPANCSADHGKAFRARL